MNLQDPVLPLSPYFCSQLGSFRFMLLGGKRSGEMNTGVSFQKVDCLARSVSIKIASLEDIELATDLTHNGQ